MARGELINGHGVGPTTADVRVCVMQSEQTSNEEKQAAFESIYNEYFGPLVDFIRRYSRLENAEDIAQEALFCAWRGMPEFNSTNKLRNWIYQIAKNKVIDEARVIQRRVPSIPLELAGKDGMMAEDILPAPDSALTSPETAAIVGEQVDIARSALKAMPPEDRKPIVLRDILGYAYVEISEKMGKPLSDTKWRIYNGRRKGQIALRAAGY